MASHALITAFAPRNFLVLNLSAPGFGGKRRLYLGSCIVLKDFSTPCLLLISKLFLLTWYLHRLATRFSTLLGELLFNAS